MLLIFQESERTNVLYAFYCIRQSRRFQVSFQKKSSSFFVGSDEFSGGQTTGYEESLFFVYAAQVLEALSSIRYDKLRKLKKQMKRDMVCKSLVE